MSSEGKDEDNDEGSMRAMCPLPSMPCLPESLCVLLNRRSRRKRPTLKKNFDFFNTVTFSAEDS